MRVLVIEDEAKLAAHVCAYAKNYSAKVCIQGGKMQQHSGTPIRPMRTLRLLSGSSFLRDIPTVHSATKVCR